MPLPLSLDPPLDEDVELILPCVNIQPCHIQGTINHTCDMANRCLFVLCLKGGHSGNLKDLLSLPKISFSPHACLLCFVPWDVQENHTAAMLLIVPVSHGFPPLDNVRSSWESVLDPG